MSNQYSVELLKKLIAFPSVSLTPNMSLIEYVKQLLAEAGIESTIVRDPSGTRANLFASTGPADVPGIALSGHTDVVPVEGQAWDTPAFEAVEKNNKIYGRGSSDMKGFVACAVHAMLRAAKQPLARPLQLVLSYDEEIGCIGVRSMLDLLAEAPIKPLLCIIGEPTLMQIAVGHKGKANYRAFCCGKEGHSSLAPNYPSAIYAATDFISGLRKTQHHVAEHGHHDHEYDIPYSTIHVGKIQGGKAMNIVPSECTVDFEIRTVANDHPEDLLAKSLEEAQKIMHENDHQHVNPQLPKIEMLNTYPGLNAETDKELMGLVKSLLPADTRQLKVAFGTEGGLFQKYLNTNVLVCGPGDINMAHKPNEFVDIEQIERCDQFLSKLIGQLSV